MKIKILTTILLCLGIGLSAVGQNLDINGVKTLAQQGDSEAQCDLGLCYYNGEGVRQDYERAAYWWSKAAKQGHVDSMNNLGLCYDYGHGVEKSKAQAIYWYKKAAEHGSKESQDNLRSEGISW